MPTHQVNLDDCAHRFLARLRTLLRTDPELQSIASESPVRFAHATLLQLASEVMIGIPDTATNDDLDDYPQVAELYHRLQVATAQFIFANGGRLKAVGDANR